MTAPKSVAAYGDCEEHFQRALNSANGIAVTLEAPGMATRFRQKMNSYRALLRRQSQKVYEPSDPRFNTSPYDAYALVEDKENFCRVLIRKY